MQILLTSNDAEARAARGCPRTRQQVWFSGDDTALVARNPTAEPVVVPSGHWRRFGVDAALVDSR